MPLITTTPYQLDPNLFTLNTVTFVGTLSINNNNIGGIFLRPDGTDFYIIEGQGAQRVLRYNLSTPWQLSSGSLSNTFSAGAQGAFLYDVFFKPDGTKMYTSGKNPGNTIYEYDLSTPWNPATASFNGSFSGPGDEITGFHIKSDGLSAILMTTTGAGANEVIKDYSLSPAWDITTLSLGNTTNISGSTGGNAWGVYVKDDGTKAFVSASVSSTVFEYNLSTPWDVSSISFVQSNTAFQGVGARGVYLSTTGDKIYVSSADTDDYVKEYDLT